MKLATKLIIAFIAIIGLMLAAAYYYLYSTGTVNTNTNITKIEDTNKIYTYDIYSDFYFRVVKYDSNGDKDAEYVELQPLKTSIGFDLSNKSHKPIIQTIKGDKLILGEKDSDSLRKFRVMLQKFEKDFGKIVATQDSAIIKSSIQNAKKIVKNLYGIELAEQNFEQGYYEEIKNLPIENMRIRHFKLEQIPKNLKEPLKVAPNKKGEWRPNMLEWNFGEKDKIYLQYLMKWENSDLENFISKNYKNKVVAKLVKINNNQLKKMYFIKIDGQNRLDTLYMDDNGYVYILTFEASNPNAFEKYISDYLKIAYGVYFVDVKGFDNWWAKEHDEVEKQNRLNKQNEVGGSLGFLVCNKVLDKFFGDDFISFFNLKKYEQDVYTLESEELKCIGTEEDIFIPTKKVNLDKFYYYYKKESFKNLEIDIEKKLLLREGVKKFNGLFVDGRDKLKLLCPNGSMECVQNLKNNNWEEKESPKTSGINIPSNSNKTETTVVTEQKSGTTPNNTPNEKNTASSSFTDVFVWFVSEVDYANYDLNKDVLGFACLEEDEIILTIGDYKYEHDKNEFACTTEEIGSNKFRHNLIWKKTSNVFELGKTYKVSVVEEDIVEDDYFNGKDITFTQDSIDIVNRGEVLSAEIGNGYYVYFSKE